MKYLNSGVRPIATLASMASLVALLLATGCSKPADIAASTTPASVSATQQTKIASKLGDLFAFQSMAAEVATQVSKGDFSAAKAKAKELEVSWDSAEAGLKPRAAADWHVIDKAVDQMLTAVRAETPNPAECEKVTAALLATFDSFNAKK